MTMTRRRLLDDTFKKTVDGNPAIATDSLARMYPGIVMQGWTEQTKTTGAQLINQDETAIGGLAGNTGNEFDSTNRIRTGFIRVEPNTTYIISGLSGFNIANSFAYDSEKTMARFGAVTTTTTTTTLENESYLRISFSKPDQSDFTEEELQKLRKTLMFNKGGVALPWEPYTGSQPSPSPEYPQEIVNAGKYNEETQKWEYEITITNAQTDPDKNQTVTLTADHPLTKWDRLEKRNGQWGWVYGSVEVDMSSEVTWNIHKGYEQETSNLFIGVMSGVGKIDPTDAILCNILPYYQAASADVNGIYPLSNNLFARIVGIKSLEDFQERIQGGKVLAKLSTETFVPLTSSEQEAMNNLYTYRPTTVLTNQQGCQMTLTYKTRKGVGGG